MELSEQQRQALTSIAGRLLESLQKIEKEADRQLRASVDNRSGTGSFALPWNSMVGAGLAEHKLDSIRQQIRDDLKRLRQEPFVVTVLVEDENGAQERYYFTRAGLPRGDLEIDGRLASYRAPVGRLAEFAPGETVTLAIPQKRELTIIERIRLRPEKGAEKWDGVDDRIEIDDWIVNLESLLEFLERLDRVPPEDLIESILAEADAKAAVSDRFRKHLIDRISLRDQPTLDKYQGEVFRLPLDRRLMLSGPPGTGKTTTLIKRLVQKRNIDELLEEERSLVPPEQVAEFFHPDNWVMFTPTDLLKLFLKEAFAQEGVAAPDSRVRTWSDERRRLARNVLRILRSEQGGRFTLDDGVLNFIDSSSPGLTKLSKTFEDFAQKEIASQYEAALEALSHDPDPDLVEIVARFRRQLGGDGVIFESIFRVAEFHDELREFVNRLSDQATETFRLRLNTLLAKNRNLLDELGSYLETIAQEADVDEDDDEDNDEEDEGMTARDRRSLAVLAFRRAIFARAVSLARGRRLGENSRNAKVLDWLGDRVTPDEKLKSLGELLVTLRRLRFLGSTYRNLIDRIPALYGRFRRAALREKTWYSEDLGRGRVSGAEVDIMLLSMLRHGRRFLSMNAGALLRYDTRNATLENLKREYTTQVLVDEATDFSAVQLACMLEMAHPTFRSLFVCGDVHQRVTRWGMRDLAELTEISPDFEVKEVDIGYRQSRKLMELAIAIAQLDGGPAPKMQVPEDYEQSEIKPALGEKLTGEALARWLGYRIHEIERTLGVVPSIAIFVDADEQIDGLVSQLKPTLMEHNLDVIGCPGGRVVGGDGQIRVFDVQHIKGLEFEAVFFVGVDALLARYGELFHKLLFVGVTRAATYLGVTCQETLPAVLDSLRHHFCVDGWARSDNDYQ